MFRMPFPLAALVLSLAVSGQAQVDLIWTNVSSTVPAEYHDGVVIYDSLQQRQRPLAHLINSSSMETLGTGSVVDSPWHLNVGGTDYLYFFDNNVDILFRGADGNLNGVIDPTEFEPLWDIRGTGNISPDTIQHFNGRWVLSNDLDALGSSTRGVWILDDTNGDGDYYDPGEATQVVNGGTGSSTFVVGGATMSSDNIDAAALLTNGDVIFYEDDDRIWYRWEAATGTITTWLGYQTTTGNAAAQPQNPDFGTILPAASLDLDKISIDYSTLPETIYLAMDFSSSQPYIFRIQDLNQNGTVNDTGEVQLFYHGVTGPTPTYATDQIKWFQGSLYVMSERNVMPSSAVRGDEFYQLTDLDMNGDALGLNEQAVIASFPDGGSDPQVIGFTVVPAGTFGLLSCVGAHIEAFGVDSAGGTVQFTFSNIPDSGIGGMALAGVSLTGDATLTVGPGCIAGLTVDSVTNVLLTSFRTEFSSPVIVQGTGVGFNSVTTNGMPVAPGVLTPGTVFYYAGVIIEPGGGLIATQTRTVTTL